MVAFGKASQSIVGIEQGSTADEDVMDEKDVERELQRHHSSQVRS